MLVASKTKTEEITAEPVALPVCYHCGTVCINDNIHIEDKAFCCEGCKLVYEIINENGLCDYYKLQSHPGLAQIKAIRNDKYAYLDNEEIARQLYLFTDGSHTIVTFYIPSVHCSSCMWLLEHLHKLNDGVTESRLNFSTKEATIHFDSKKISLRQVTELLATIGYEPYISLDEAGKKKAKTYNKQRIFKLGVAGFCFGNIMMMSFPEYLSTATGIEPQYMHLFRYLNLLLALPVIFFSATEFFVTAWKGIKQRTLNIDAPIALAIIITFGRSVYEILNNTGAGYLDSMSGIVFFMLVGRAVQERAYKSLSFTRDYKSYFPIAVNVITDNGVRSKKLQDLQKDDLVQLHNDEIIPADGMIVEGRAYIDYSFVTGESEPVAIKQNELVYAGGKQTGEQIVIKVVKPVAGSYLTSLWNHYAFAKNKMEKNDSESIVHVLSRYFTVILLSLAAITTLYWYFHDPSKIFTAVSAMLIVACPCALLLSATFTNASILRLLSNNGFFLRDASVIETLGKTEHIVFDKTGTITQNGGNGHYTDFIGHQLNEDEKDMLFSVIRNSSHPNSKALIKWLGARNIVPVTGWKETPGSGIEAVVGDMKILVGSAMHVGLQSGPVNDKPTVYVKINNCISSFYLHSVLRNNVDNMIAEMSKKYKLSLLSGDNDRQRALFRMVFGPHSKLLFNQKPIDKLNYIESLQQNGEVVTMIGDGLNDAGALQQSNTGITVADDVNNFTPSCDAILDAGKFNLLPSMLKLAVSAKYIIASCFVVSIVYNIVGLTLSMQGMMKPVTAAILMPCSTLSIVLISNGFSSLIAKYYKLGLHASR